METPSSCNVLPSEWQPELEFTFDSLDTEEIKWLKWKDPSLNANSSFVVISVTPHRDGTEDGVTIIAQEKTSGKQIDFTNHSCMSNKAIRL